MRYLLMLLSTCGIIVGCTFSINTVQSEGPAKDAVEETTDNCPNIVPMVNLPSEII